MGPVIWKWGAMRTWTRLLAFIAAVVLIPLTAAPAAPTQSVSEWKPGCGIDGHPIDLTFFFCNTGHFNGAFDGAMNNYFFFGSGASFNLAIYDSSERGFQLWGPLDESKFEEIGPSEVRGSGAPDDPFEHRGVFAAGQPRQLLIHAYTEYVNGTASFDSRWEVTNVSASALNFRASVFADTSIHGMCAYGDFTSAPRTLGSFSPQEGVPYEPNDCYATDRDRGFGGYAIEQPASVWSAYQQGQEDVVRAQITDASDGGLDNTFDPRPIREAMAVQWDDVGRGKIPLGPGETASFSLRWRFSSELLATPFLADSPDNVHRVKLTTRFARNGPTSAQRLAYRIGRDLGSNGSTRGTVITNERGVAHVSWRKRNDGFDGLTVSFDSNRDGRIQQATELYRTGMSVRWGRTAQYYRTRLSFEQISDGFQGRIRAVHEDDPNFGADCRKHRTIAVRRSVPGRDPTLGSAVSNLRGVWDLDVPAPTGGHYAIVLAEWRSPLDGPGYRCRGARSS